VKFDSATAFAELFTTEAGMPVNISRGSYGWSSVQPAKLPFPVHPHMLRHSQVTSSPIRARILDHWRITSDIAICNRLRDTLRLRLIGSQNSGRTRL